MKRMAKTLEKLKSRVSNLERLQQMVGGVTHLESAVWLCMEVHASAGSEGKPAAFAVHLTG
jgi:hypothetical protein